MALSLTFNMTGLPEFFQQTSDLPYDRHHYRLHLADGRTFDADNWEAVQSAWFELPGLFTSHIEVLDKPKLKPKGF